MNRRTIVASAIMALALPALTGCAVSAGGDDLGSDSLAFASFGSEFQDSQIEAWQVPYTEESRVGFVNDTVDSAKLKAMVDAGSVSWDLADQAMATAVSLCGDYLEPIDLELVDTSGFPEGTVTECAVPAYSYNLMMLYNEDQLGDDAPTSAADFFDLERYPGKRMLPPNFWVGLLEFALLADGVEADQLYPLDVDRALAKYDTIKDEIIFTSTYGEVQQGLESEQANLAISLTARAVLAIDNGAPYAPVWDAIVVNSDAMVIPKGAPNKDAAMEFLAYIAEDASQKTFAETSGMAPVDPSIIPNYTDTQTLLDPTANGFTDLVYVDAQWWGENLDELTKTYTEWQVS